MTRIRLPQRRSAQTFEFEHEGVRYTGTVGHFTDGRIAELFLNSAKIDSAADVNARDGAVAISLALQYGCPAETLKHAMMRNPDGGAMGPLGKLLDIASET